MIFWEETLLVEKKMPKKSVASKFPKGLSASEYDRTQFVSADFVTQRSGIKEWGFDIDVENAQAEDFQRVIHSRVWQLFCKHPKVTAMSVVLKFFVNAVECNSGYTVFVRGKLVRYDVGTINQLFRLPYNPSGPNEVDYLMNSANMEEVSNAICKNEAIR